MSSDAQAFDPDEIASAVANLVYEHYVFPEQAADLSGLLRTRIGAGDYRSVSEPAELATILTTDLQSTNGDRHLRVLHTAEPVADLADEDEELAVWTARADADSGGIARVELLQGEVGLVELRPIIYPAELVADRIAEAMTIVGDASALILDVRNCVGGSPDTVALICSYVFDDKPVHLNSMVDGSGAETSQSWTLASVPGRRFGGEKPVAVLVGSDTFSGGEELAYNLQQLGRATIVGEQTGGGAHPRVGFRVYANLEATIPVARARNPVSGTNWELIGVTPDIPIAGDRALDRALELLSD